VKLPLDSTKVTRVCEYMMIGLAWHHWQREAARWQVITPGNCNQANRRLRVQLARSSLTTKL
jgi:hypothetical protein